MFTIDIPPTAHPRCSTASQHLMVQHLPLQQLLSLALSVIEAYGFHVANRAHKRLVYFEMASSKVERSELAARAMSGPLDGA